ncbi:MAG: phosphatase PAP2 family protein [Micromonosporaceae bacterium]
MPMPMTPASAGAARPAVLAQGASAPVPRTSGAHGVDKTLFLDVNHFAQHTGWLHAPMLAYATYGVALFGLLLVAGWWASRRRGDPKAMAAAIWALIGTIIAVAVAQPINHAVAEARPWQSLPHILALAGHSTDFSFPSDHATMAGAVTAGLLLYNRRLGIISALAAVLMCFARVYVGAHYPQDVAAGLALGVVVVLVGYAVVRIPLGALVARLSATPLRPLFASAADPPGEGGPSADPAVHGLRRPAAGEPGHGLRRGGAGR